MATTASGVFYPVVSGSGQLWAHMQQMGESVEAVLNAAGVGPGSAWTTYTPTVKYSGMSWATKTGYWLRVGPKTVYVNIYLVSNQSGSGSTAMNITLPLNPLRTVRQVIPGHAEGVDSSSNVSIAFLEIFRSGTGNLVDRIRVGSSGGALSNLHGDRITSNTVLHFQGIYREA